MAISLKPISGRPITGNLSDRSSLKTNQSQEHLRARNTILEMRFSLKENTTTCSMSMMNLVFPKSFPLTMVPMLWLRQKNTARDKDCRKAIFNKSGNF